MNENLREHILALVGDYIDPILSLPLADTKSLITVVLNEKSIAVNVQFHYPITDFQSTIQQALTEKIQTVSDLPCEVQVAWQVQSHAIQATLKSMPQVKNIIAVASGKGGVGKSTTAVNMALALQLAGAKVGILDADIYGPNQPQMLGVVDERPMANEHNKVQPLVRYGMQSMSIGYLIDANQPMIWRGPMVSSALQQLLNDTAWQDLDYLIIDLPPGTGDIQLTLSQKIPVTGAVIVTTPQEVALADARKGLAMFRKVKVPILGIVENMSYHLCEHCQEKSYLFGQGGGQKMAEQYNVPFLGEVPLLAKIREQADAGKPIVLAEPESQMAQIYRKLALTVAAQLSLQGKNYSARFPQIVIENN